MQRTEVLSVFMLTIGGWDKVRVIHGLLIAGLRLNFEFRSGVRGLGMWKTEARCDSIEVLRPEVSYRLPFLEAPAPRCLGVCCDTHTYNSFRTT